MTPEPEACNLQSVPDEQRLQPHHPRSLRYDEQLALQKLEQLRRDIQAARRRGQQASDDFEKFITGFREPGSPRPVAERTAGAPPAATPAAAAPPLVQPEPSREPVSEPSLPAAGPDFEPLPPPKLGAPPVSLPAAEALPAPTELPPPMRAAVRSPRRAITGVQLAGIAAVAAVLSIGGFLLLRPTNEPAPASSSPAAGSPAPTRATPGPPPATSASKPSDAASAPTAGQTSPAPQPRALRLELSAARPVWIRVTVDGRRSIEREVAAGFRATIDADRAVAIRAGDAGALSVGVNGARAVPLGRTGQVATRIFSAPEER